MNYDNYDNEERNEEIDDFTTERMEELMNGTGNVSKGFLRKKGKEALKKAGKGITKKVGSVLVKVGAKGLGLLCCKVGLVIFALIFAFFIFWVALDVTTESKGKNQNYQDQSADEMNHLVLDKNGETMNTGLSKGNKMYKAFYTFFSKDSYYMKIEGSDKLYKASEKNKEVVDLYGREKDFYLNPDILWALDEYLHGDTFRYPEQFLKPVKHDKDYNLEQLTDDKRRLTAESSKYEKKTETIFVEKADPNDKNSMKLVYIDNITKKETFNAKDKDGKNNSPKKEVREGLYKTDEKVKGVWDYGLAPILFYKKYKIKQEWRGQITKFEVWDEEAQKKVWVDSTMNIPRVKIPDGYPKDAWMIDKVTTYAGTITNNIVQEFEDTGEPFKPYYETYKEKVNVKVEKVRDVHATEEGSQKKLYYQTDEKGQMLNPVKIDTVQTNFPYMVKEKYIDIEKKEMEFKRKIEGTIYDSIPKYEGEPDMSNVQGKRYIQDYMSNYETYAPTNVQGKIDLGERTGKTDAELEALMEADPHLNPPTANGENITGEIDGVELGSGATSQNYKNAIQYIEFFEKYGNMFGVDPYILIAKSAQESGGKHNPGSYSGGGFGIMQIENPGTTTKSVTAYNFETGANETVNVRSTADVTNVEDNIKVGTMMFASRLPRFNYNIAMSIQAYNYNYMLDKVLEAHSQATGISVDEMKANQSDTSWTGLLMDAHINPKKYIPSVNYSSVCNQPKCDARGGTGHYGDPHYLSNVLRYYASPDSETPWVKRPDGEQVEGSGSFPTGSATGLQFASADSFIKKVWAKIENYYDYYFGKKPKYSKESFHYKNFKSERQSDTILTMMFAMGERKKFSEYGEITDEMFKEKLHILMSNPIGSKWTEKKNEIDPNKYFPKGYGSPLKLTPLTIIGNYGNIKNKFEVTEFHGGIDISAPKGTPVYAISDGKVTVVDKDKGIVQISHGNNVTTVYKGLSNISVEVNKEIKKGVQIGKTGSSCGKDGLHIELLTKDMRIDPSFIITGTGEVGTGGDATAPQSIEGSQKAKQVYEIAKKFVGSWYAWGGNQPPEKDSNGNWIEPKPTGVYDFKEKGFDCSSYMVYIFKHGANIQLPRTAEMQRRFATPINKADIQPGDLIFTKRGSADASHVVMYIGNGKIIHSPRSGKRITTASINLNDPTKFVGRVLK